MNGCQFFAVEISALIDGELPPAAVLRTIDHILGCDRCRGFYGSARAVEGLLAEAGGSSPTAELPRGLWTRIAEATRGPEAAEARTSATRVPAWARRAAAMTILALGAAVIAAVLLLPRSSGDSDMVIDLEGRSGVMTDARFVTIAAELLEADRQYHMKMQQIMAAVNQETFVPEGSLDRGALLEAPASELLRASSEIEGESDSSARFWY